MKRHLSFVPLTSLILLSSSLAIGAASAQATTSGPNPNQPLVSDDQMRAMLGNVSYSLSTCGYGSRSVVVHATRLQFEGSGLTREQGGNAVHEAFRRAILFAWQNCPLKAHASGDPYMVDSADMLLPDGTRMVYATNLKATRVNFGNGLAYDFETVIDTRPNIFNAIDQFFGWVWRIAKTVFWTTLFGGLVVWLFRSREAIARWYYYLTPLPAETTVNARTKSGSPLGGSTVAGITIPTPGGRVENEVRGQQARSDAKFKEAQEELARATKEHELAKARRDALRKRKG